MTSLKRGMTAIFLIFGSSAIASPALAWGCVAVSVETESDQTKWDDLTYGYSFRFNDQLEAQSVALKECSIRTEPNRTCKLMMCESAY